MKGIGWGRDSVAEVGLHYWAPDGDAALPELQRRTLCGRWTSGAARIVAYPYNKTKGCPQCAAKAPKDPP